MKKTGFKRNELVQIGKYVAFMLATEFVTAKLKKMRNEGRFERFEGFTRIKGGLDTQSEDEN